MYELFKAEFLRYRKWAIFAFIGQLGLWGFITKIKPLLAPSSPQEVFILLLCMFGGLAFGIVQMVLHRRKNNWTWLIQRPLPTKKIYLALSGAAFTNILIAIPTAWLFVLLGVDLFTNTVVDIRHYVFGLYMTGMTVTGYLVGSLIILSANRGAFLLIGMMFYWVFPKPESMTMLFTVMGLITLSFWYLNLKSFKPDLNKHISNPLYVVLMGVPMQIALAFVLMLGSTVYYHIPRFIIGDHPDKNPVEGSMSYLWHVDDSQVVGHILKDQDIPNKDRLIRQAELADVDYINTRGWTFPSQGQMYQKDYGYGLFDGPTRTRWVFANDEMMLQGTDSVSDEITGWLGKSGFHNVDDVANVTPFEFVPFMMEDKFLVTPKRVYQVDYEHNDILVKFEAPEGTKIINLPSIGETFVSIVTSTNSYLFDKETYLTEFEVAEADYILEHPIAVEKLQRVETRRLLDGYLALYFSRHFNGYQKEAVIIKHAKLGGEVTQVSKTDYHVSRHPAVIDNLDYVLSPGVFMLTNQLMRTLQPSDTDYSTISETLARDYQASVRWTALILMIISSLTVLLMSRRIKLSGSMTATWTIMSLVFGLPALVSFFLMNKVRGN